jgi:hypothetical protein
MRTGSASIGDTFELATFPKTRSLYRFVYSGSFNRTTNGSPCAALPSEVSLLTRLQSCDLNPAEACSPASPKFRFSRGQKHRYALPVSSSLVAWSRYMSNLSDYITCQNFESHRPRVALTCLYGPYGPPTSGPGGC